MSPEQAQGKALDARSDLYSVGVLLYEMLTGRPPFAGADAILVMAQHIKEAPKKPSTVCPEAHIPADLEDLIMRALAKDPAERPESAEAFGEALGRLAASGLVDTTGVRSVRPSAPAESGTLATGEVETATAPFPARRKRRRIGLLLGIVIAAGLFANVIVLSMHRTPPRVAAPEGPLPSSIPPATPTASGAAPSEPASEANTDIPTIRAEALPVASSRTVPAAAASTRRTPRAPSPPMPRAPRQAQPTPTPSSGSNYQYLE
jgi:serine/threonine-protein kinase